MSRTWRAFRAGMWGYGLAAALGVFLFARPAVSVADLRQLFEDYRLWLVVVAAFLEATFFICFLVPGSFVVLLAVLFSSASASGLLAVYIASLVGLVIGTSLSYFMGRIGGASFARWAYRASDQRASTTVDLRFRRFLLAGIYANFMSILAFSSGLQDFGLGRTVAWATGAFVVWVAVLIVVLASLAQALSIEELLATSQSNPTTELTVGMIIFVGWGAIRSWTDWMKR